MAFLRIQRPHRAAFVGLSVASLLGGCATLSPLTTPATNFTDAANALATAESAYFDEIQAASDAGHRLRAIADYTAHAKDFPTVEAEFTSHDDFGPAKAARVKVMTQLQTYAKAVDAIAGGASTSALATEAKTTSSDIDKLAGAVGAKGLSAKDFGIAQTAVTTLGTVIIDRASAKKLQSLAGEAKDPLAQIRKMIEADEANIETDRFAPGLVADQTNEIKNILHVIYDDQKSGDAERFQAAVIATNWKPSLVTQGKAILAALQKLEGANDALAAKNGHGAKALVREAYDLAQEAIAASKTK